MRRLLVIDTIAILRRQAEHMRATGYKLPEIKGVQFKRTKNQHKPLRNVVTRVVMVGFDPFNNSGLPEHIERQVVHDYWTNEEQQFVLDWVNDAPAGEVRFGCLLNMYGTEDNYKPFPDLTIEEQRKVDEVDTYFDYAFRSDRVVENGIVKRDKHGPSGVPDEFALRRKLIEGMGLPPHLVSAGQRTAALRIPKMTNEVSYNGVKLSQIEIPTELEKTRQLVIELIKEVAMVDHPNLLTLFVARGGNIRDLTEFFALVKVAGEKEQILEDSFERDLRGMRDLQRLQQLADTTMHLDPAIDRNSVRGIFPLMVLEKTGPDLSEVESDNPIFRSNLCPEVQTLEGELVPRVTGAYAVGADGVKRDLRDINLLDLLLGPVEGDFIDGDMERELQATGLMRPEGGIDVFKVATLAKRNTPIEGELVDKGVEVRVIPEGAALTTEYGTRPNPLREHWEKYGDPYEGRIPHIAQFSELVKLTSQSGRNETLAVHLSPITIPGTIEDDPTPISEALYEQLKADGCVLPDGNVDLSKVHCEREPEVLTPEDIADREQAMQEASEGKLDYLLEGTQWDPKNRNN